MRELIEPYLWMPQIPLRFNAKDHQRNYCRLMKKSKWLGGRVACMTGNIIATKTFYRTTHRFCTVDVCHLNSSSLHSDATAQFCNRTTGARIVKVLLLWHPTILSCTLFGAFLCSLAQLPPGRGMWLYLHWLLESGEAQEASRVHFPLKGCSFSPVKYPVCFTRFGGS